ncbi:hypothetical protein COR50_04590 [Chitinophaga caeni]|uniref:DUF2007 domain-containing protein n=1 Tax=Chitinophaga caeni TaxID=2029983 RepID=A0A291QRC5_9BACT|nr:DUF2007 domain-containing protein [Chitinophaga caeni]ATL46510.1 hypothetical protein COR50_04590 [Chitinophaga caeni]
MEKGWIKVYETRDPFKAEIVKGMLIENGIEAVIVNKQDSSFTQMIPGLDEVYVQEVNETLAKQLVAEGNPTNEG